MELALFPLDVVLFPGMELPLHIFEERYRVMVNRCLAETSGFGVVWAGPARDSSQLAAISTVGTMARIMRVKRLDDGRMNIVTKGTERFRILEIVQRQPYLTARVEGYDLEEQSAASAGKYALHASSLLIQYLRLAGETLGVGMQLETVPRDPSALAYTIAAGLQVSLEEKQGLLESRGLSSMLKLECDILTREVELLKSLAQFQDLDVGYIRGATSVMSLS